MPALIYAIQLLETLPGLIAAGQSVVELVNHGSDTLKSMQNEGRDPTPAEWQELNDKIKALRDDLHS